MRFAASPIILPFPGAEDGALEILGVVFRVSARLIAV